MKKLTISLFVLLVAVICVSSFVFYRKNSDPLTPINTANLIKKTDSKNDLLVYVGRPNCPACQVFNSELTRDLKNNVLHPRVYYYNTNDNRSDKDFSKVLKAMKITGVPAFVRIKNGKVSKLYVGVENYPKIKQLIK
ncbi:thioredoxin family protein [Secundilactobacillus kimchicus]|uniref:thioredoxin family protein n=1 Tax=Secundilactobacillus kimchicus TaxID=528209 RepID=UPI0024A9DF41|nr:thioredoxin family protein [Secundilactobacillus kimchicus]